MNLDQIETKCFILALFIRDDGERFLLGSRMFEFVDSQLHFTANAYQNDIVEVQGNDGVMLAGQVRRGSLQSFDGYIGDSSVERHVIEQNRRAFFKFFRKNHYYKVVYIFTDGTAIQRRQGFIVEAPEVKELYQLFPQYHVSMNFEDINYYNYEEDSEGEEIYGESATLKIATSATGGLIWEDGSQTTISGEGSSFTLNGTIDGNVLDSLSIKGNTTQQTYSGKNLLNDLASPTQNNLSEAGITATINADGTISISGTVASTYKNIRFDMTLPAGTYWFGGCPSGGSVDTYSFCVQPSGEGTTFDTGSGGTFTLTTSKVVAFYPVRIGGSTGFSMDGLVFEPIVVAGSTPADYEPYVGGIPAPNPDYPQTVNTVTGRQLVTISDGDSQSQSYELNLGKNLFDAANPNILWGYISAAGVITQGGVNTDAMFYIPCSPNTTYTVQKGLQTTTSKNRFRIGTTSAVPDYNATVNDYWRMNDGDTVTSHTVTTSNNARYLVVYCYGNDTETTRQALFDTVQVEKGSTATTYAPYFTPIELCKIGTYQDYIYKSGDDWYLHKAVGKYVFTGSEVVGKSGTTSNNAFYYASSQNVGTFGFSDIDQTIIGNNPDSSVIPPVYSSNFTSTSPIAVMNTSIAGITFNKTGSGIDCRLGFTLSSSVNTAQLLTTWLATNTPSVYYPLATATDIQITNTSLISQLNALAAATTYDGQTIFTVTSENLPAILNVSVIAINNGGVVWDEYGATWEEGTGGGPTMIDIESIDNVYPVWELTGPAVNPQISVLNTNTILSYTGAVTASQTLKIDMFNKTATLNGASVIGNVSGDWVYLEPGINRVTYTANNADASDSVIWWQEIVG